MLSIITVTRNDIVGLTRTLESTIAIRTLPGVEQLVIDGSDHEQASENHELSKKHTGVIYLKREARGISDAFNFGISYASNQWFWFLNGGDQLYRALDLNFFYSFLNQVRADVLIFQIERTQTQKIVQFPPLTKGFPPVIPWIPHPGTIVKRGTFLTYGTFDERYKIAMDYEFWLRIYGKRVIVNLISIPIASYDETGLSSTQIGRVSYEGKEILKRNKIKLFKLWVTTGRDIIKQYRRFNRLSNEN